MNAKCVDAIPRPAPKTVCLKFLTIRLIADHNYYRVIKTLRAIYS